MDKGVLLLFLTEHEPDVTISKDQSGKPECRVCTSGAVAGSIDG